VEAVETYGSKTNISVYIIRECLDMQNDNTGNLPDANVKGLTPYVCFWQASTDMITLLKYDCEHVVIVDR
jgi:hypothetical protein